jgi:tetratricopeptide (TPR) repeat protein
MRQLISLIVGICFCSTVFAQNFKKEFTNAYSLKDTASQNKILNQWYKQNPEDPEYYTSAFNYYLIKVAQGDPNVQRLLQEGFDVINVGIKKFPDRLDMRFGKAFLIKEIRKYDDFTDEIIEVIEYSQKNNHKWKWTENTSKDKSFFVETIQSYIVELYELGDDQAGRMGRIAEAALKYYPDNVEFLSDLSISYTLKGDLQSALKPLLKAVDLNSKDYIVLNNLGELYTRLQDKANAIKYSELAIKYGNEEVKSTAQKRIDDLK